MNRLRGSLPPYSKDARSGSEYSRVYRESIGQGPRVGQHAVSPPQALYTASYVGSECSARASCALRLPQGSVRLA